jgi:hypothetical protein
MRRQQAQAQSVANLRNLVNPPPLPLSASLSLNTSTGTGLTLSNINVQMPAAPTGTSSTLSNINVRMPAAPTVPVAAPLATLAPASTLQIDSSTQTKTFTSELMTFLPRGRDSGDTPRPRRLGENVILCGAIIVVASGVERKCR